MENNKTGNANPSKKGNEQKNEFEFNSQTDPHKKKKSKGKIAAIVAASLLAIGGGTWLFTSPNGLKGFDGVGEYTDQNPNDSSNMPTDPRSKLRNAMAINLATNGGPISDLESFQEMINNSIQASDGTIVGIPAICTLFQLASADMSNTKLIDEFIDLYLATNQSATILIEGYACDLGSNASNMILSKNRAEQVKQYFINHSVSENNIEIKWYGESKYKELGYPNKENHRRVNISIK